MKYIKLKKVHYKDLGKLLKDCDLVDGMQAYPSNLFVNPKDYKEIEKQTKLQFKKEYPSISKRTLDSSVAMHLLNIGPNTSEAVKIGYGIVKGYSNDDE